MTRLTPRQRLEHVDLTALTLSRLRPRMDAVARHLSAELAILDGHTSGGDGAVVTATSELTTVEAAADARLRLGRWVDDIDAGLRLLLVTALDLGTSLDGLLGMRAQRHAEAVEGRCNGKVDPTCQNMASPHHDHAQGGQTVDGLCDQCWTASCPRCHERPVAAPQRLVTVGGRLVAGCEACYRSERRTTAGVA